MKKTIEMLNTHPENWDDGEHRNCKEFNKFFRVFKKELTPILIDLGCKDIEYHKGWFSITGFFEAPDGLRYFSFEDVRHWPRFLVRTAKNRKDFTGGSNHFLDIKSDTFKDEFLTILEWG